MSEHNIPKEYTKILNDLNSINIDLENSKSALNELIKLDISNSGIIEISLYRFAIISFIKCFAGGIRKFHLTSEIFSQMPNYSPGLYNYYKDYRDKYVAHSVNKLENHQFTVKIEGRIIDRIDTYSYYAKMDQIEIIRNLLVLVNKSIDYVNSQIKIEETKLISILVSNKLEVLTSWPIFENKGLNVNYDSVKSVRKIS